MAAWTITRTADEIVATLRDQQIPVSRMNSIARVRIRRGRDGDSHRVDSIALELGKRRWPRASATRRTTRTTRCSWGTEGSLSFPSLTLWHFRDADEPGWKSPLITSHCEEMPNDPYLDQIENFTKTIRGVASAVVEGSDALRSLAVIEAIKRSWCHASRVSVTSFLGSGV
jgi:predicted dehydrogenase